MSLAVIPARGGSKRIPRKNIRLFAGRPVIAWSIAAAREAGLERVVVSTDDEEIAAIAMAEGAEVPFRRPTALADDLTPTRPVIAHAVEALGAEGPVACIYPAAPFLEGADLRAGLAALGPGVTYALAVTLYPHPIQRALRRHPDGRIEMLSPEHAHTRSQDLEEAWHDAGQFYCADAATWATDAPILSSRSVGIPLPGHRAHDIDTEEDWERAERMFQAHLT
ncbi:MAG: pseudaminic acid cytidylyltransferase [Pseudomonadota bacterium]